MSRIGTIKKASHKSVVKGSKPPKSLFLHVMPFLKTFMPITQVFYYPPSMKANVIEGVFVRYFYFFTCVVW